MPLKPRASYDIVANDKTAVGLRSSQNRLNRFSTTLKRSLTGIGLAIGAAGILRLAREASESADALAKQSDILGITTEKLAAYQLAARLSGSGNDQLEKGIRKLQKSIVDATNGLTTYTRAFDELKLDPAELKALTPDEQFERLAQAFAKVDNQATKVSVAYDLFGGRNVALLNLLDKVGTEMNQLERDTQRWGIALSRTDAAKIEDARDAFERANTAVKGLATQLAVTLAPTLDDIATRFADAASASDGFFASIGGAIASGTSDVNKRAEELRDKIERLKKFISLQEAFGGDDPLTKNLRHRLSLFQSELEQTESTIRLQERQQQLNKQLQESMIEPIVIDSVKISPDLRIENAEAISRQINDSLLGVFDNQDLIPELTIETNIDRILRPEVKEDVEFLQRNVSLLGDEVRETSDAARDLGLTFSSAFEDAVLSGEKLSDVLRGLLKDIARIAIRQAITLPLGGFFGNLFSGLFGGSRDSGGPVVPGQIYEIGKGQYREYFAPSTPGMVTPMRDQQASIVQNFNFPLVFPPQLESQIRNIAAPAGREAATQVLQARRGRF